MKIFRVIIDINGGEYDQYMYITANSVTFDESTESHAKYLGIIADGIKINYGVVVNSIDEVNEIPEI